MSRGSRFTAALAAGLVAAAVFTAPAAAQSSDFASIAATATVVGGIAPLTAAGVSDLAFGSVTAGTPRTIDGSTASSAGRFYITGEPSRAVSISFALPPVLTGSGSATIPITFGTSVGLLFGAYPTVASTFNPNAIFGTSIAPSGSLTIGIGGTVSPVIGAVSGLYTGTITMTVTY